MKYREVKVLFDDEGVNDGVSARLFGMSRS